jgi:hypothetical protein
VRAGAFLIIGGLIAARAGAADEQPICADRPGKASAPCAAPVGHFQVESGLADWALDKSDGERDTFLIIGSTAIKYGVADRSHIELDVTPWERATSRVGGAKEDASGVGDLTVRFKHEFTSPDADLQIAAYPWVKLPTANRRLSNGKAEAGIAFPIEYSIPNSPVSITLGPELDWRADEDGDGRHAAMVQVASFGVQLSRTLSLSAEIWRQWDWDPAGTVKQASADGSIAYLVNNDLQLDAGANFALNNQTPDVQVYAGVSKRF